MLAPYEIMLITVFVNNYIRDWLIFLNLTNFIQKATSKSLKKQAFSPQAQNAVFFKQFYCKKDRFFSKFVSDITEIPE
jgi:hypothetical protein